MRETIIKAVVSVAVTALWSLLMASVVKVRSKQKATDEGLKSLLRAEIIRTYEKAMDRDYCPIYSKEALTHCFHSYKELGGNGLIDDLYKKTMELPTEKEE